MPKRKDPFTNAQFIDYLKNRDLTELHHFEPTETISFHWANWESTSSFIRDLNEKDPNQQERVAALHKELLALKEIPVWLKSKRGQISSTLYDLYECYCDPRLRIHWFDREVEILVSLHNDAGPFQALSHMRWFDRNIYSQFVYLRLLGKRIPQRSFRLGLNIPIQARNNGSPINALDGKVHQISEHGMVLHFNQMSSLQHWGMEGNVTFLKTPLEKQVNQKDLRGIPEVFWPNHWFEAIENFAVPLDFFHTSIDRAGKDQKDGHVYFFIPFTEVEFLTISKPQDHKKGEVAALIEATMNELEKGIKKAS